MGLGSWLMRKGNVGGIARSVAKGWKAIIKNNLNNSTDNEKIAETYINVRYGAMGEFHLANQVLEELSDSNINPLNLAWAILLVENSGERATCIENYDSWRKIMKEEIEKLGVKPE